MLVYQCNLIEKHCGRTGNAGGNTARKMRKLRCQYRAKDQETSKLGGNVGKIRKNFGGNDVWKIRKSPRRHYRVEEQEIKMASSSGNGDSGSGILGRKHR
jgi:hypothetical protein